MEWQFQISCVSLGFSKRIFGLGPCSVANIIRCGPSPNVMVDMEGFGFLDGHVCEGYSHESLVILPATH